MRILTENEQRINLIKYNFDKHGVANALFWGYGLTLKNIDDDLAELSKEIVIKIMDFENKFKDKYGKYEGRS